MDVQKDIELFVTSEVKADTALAPFKDLIIDKIMGTSDGMFRYSKLMIEELQIPTFLTVSEVLESLPSGLNAMYARALLRLPDTLRELRQTTLMYLSCAHRPVTVEEVIYAHAARPRSNTSIQSRKDWLQRMIYYDHVILLLKYLCTVLMICTTPRWNTENARGRP